MKWKTDWAKTEPMLAEVRAELLGKIVGVSKDVSKFAKEQTKFVNA